MLAGCSTPATHDQGDHGQGDRYDGGLPAAEAPGHAELDQLGEHHGSRAQARTRHSPHAQSSSPAP